MNTERNRGRINWHQALAEVSLIAAGVLIALAVDSWWEERLERTAEIEYLRSLKLDFEANENELHRQIESEEQIINFGKQIHSNIESGFAELSPAELMELIGRFYWLQEWQPITGTYDEMVGSGRLLFLQNRELRDKLSQYVHSMEEIKTLERAEHTNWYFEQSPFIRQHLDISRFGWIGDYRPDARFQGNLQALESIEFHNLVSTWMVSHYDVILSYQGAVVAGDEILELINSDLASARK